MMGSRFRETAAQTVQPMIVESDIVSSEFPPIYGGNILPANSLAEMDNKIVGVTKFPTLGKMVFKKMLGSHGFKTEYGRVYGPILGKQPFQPASVNLGEVRTIIWVEIYDISGAAKIYFTSVLRLSQLVPPVIDISHI
jgi:hypothetical protein